MVSLYQNVMKMVVKHFLFVAGGADQQPKRKRFRIIAIQNQNHCQNQHQK